MIESRIGSCEDLVAYLCDCTLATVDRLAGLKNKSKHEFKRQISIAQLNIDKGLQLGVDFRNTRAANVIKNYEGSVEKWALRYSNKQG